MRALDLGRLREVVLSRPGAYPFVLTASLVLVLRLARLLLLLLGVVAPSAPASASGASASSSFFEGSQVAIKSWESGRYLEVGDERWIYASSFSHNKPSARFEIEPVSPAMVASLMQSREVVEQPSVVGTRPWDMRPEAAGGAGAEFTFAQDPSLADALQSSFDDEQAAEAEAERDAMESARRRLSAAARRGARGWVLLRSAYAGGYVEVLSRGEESEYVVRVASAGRLSYRSLFMLRRDAVWSHAVGGFLNWRRPTPSEPRQHVRAHGNTEPWGPLREIPPSARLHIFKPPPVVDVLGALSCPTAAPPFEWALLLDAARAGSCRGESLETLRRAAVSLASLDNQLGSGFGTELADLANSYRSVLLDEEWTGVLDLQLNECSTLRPQERAPPFSHLDAESGELRVDASQCPRAAYSEVMLRQMPDEPLMLEMMRLSATDSADSADSAAAGDAGYNASAGNTTFASAGELTSPPPPQTDLSLSPPLPPTLRTNLVSDAVFVLCHYEDPNGSGGGSDWSSQSLYQSEDEGESTASDAAVDAPTVIAGVRQALMFRLAPEVKYYSPARQKPRKRARRAVNASADLADLAASVSESGAAVDMEAWKAEAEAEAEAIEAARVEEEATAARARAARLSVLLLQLDATSRAHLHRMVPDSLATMRAMASSGRATLYEFPHYSIVGYNSLPNMVPMLAGVDAQTLIDSTPIGPYASYEGSDESRPKGVWNAFAQRGYATALLEELHDGCGDLSASAPSSASKLFYSRLGAAGMPHHNAWQIFCQPELRPCCNDPESFLQPGRRQCVGDVELPVLLLDYMRQLWRLYAARQTPRFALLNLMSAHEHFMTRLAALDKPLREFLLAMEANLRTDTALFLLSDHGTHGVWYNHFAVGQSEHRAPALLLLLPASFAETHPAAHAALLRNQRRRVTAYDLHATMQHLAAWPTMPPPSEEATSLFVDLPDARSCEAAKVPAEWCLESPSSCFDSV